MAVPARGRALRTRKGRRRRPSFAFLILLTAAAVLTVSVVAGASSKGPDPRVAYLDEVRVDIERSNDLGRELDDLRVQLPSLSRVLLGRRLDRLARESTAAVRDVEDRGSPRSLRTLHSLLVASLAVRARVVGALGFALDQALDRASLDVSTVKLASLGSDLSVSDRSYQLFVDGLPRSTLSKVAALPRSRWMTDPSWWQQGQLAALLTTMRSTASLAPVRDVALVTFATDPPAAGLEGATPVLPTARTMRVRAVVANVGNEPERRVTVSATLTAANGTVDTARRFVKLAAGQRLALQLGGLRPLAGGPSTLVVRVEPVSGETRLADNERSLPFVMR